MSPLERPRTGYGIDLDQPPAPLADLDLALATWENEGGRESREQGQRSLPRTGFGRSPLPPGPEATGGGE
jgi:hypothetical protein